ncbi:MAG: hypothetical protein NXH95_11050 [Pseudomonadaceae bacterium]|nr:hypothetical protein [Pseudomonadaceae bacterium]
MQAGSIAAAVLMLSALMFTPVGHVYAQTETQQQLEKKTKKGSANRECRRIKETGSRIAKRVCKKPEQWAREEEMAREAVNQTREESNRNTGAAGQQ